MADSTYPVHYTARHPEHFSRLQLAIRLVAFMVLGMLGVSFVAMFAVAYLLLPVIAVSRLAAGRSAELYVREEGNVILTVLHWVAAISAWVGLVSDRLPAGSPDEWVKLSVEGQAQPTANSAAWRLLTGIPSALVLALLGALGVLVWIWGALSVLFAERVGRACFAYLVGVQRWSLRLLVYQASLVDQYPPFSFSDTPPQVPMALHPAR